MTRITATLALAALAGAALVALLALVGTVVPTPAAAQLGAPRPEPLVTDDLPPEQTLGVDFEQRLGVEVPLSTQFQDETGATVTLAEIADGKPLVLVPAYYECPMLCTLVINGVVTSLDTLQLTAGQEFEVAVVSIDPDETPAIAASAKSRHLARYGHEGGDAGFHFLTGDDVQIHAVTDTIGFHYKYVPERDEFAHTAGIVVLTPDGAVARYFYGVEYPPRDVRLALVEAADERIGSPVDEIFLYCFHYDPETGRYSAAILNIVRLGGVLTLGALGLYFLLSWRRGRLRAAEGEA